jgi:hypothetical protein
MASVIAPSGSSAAPLDTVTATGNASCCLNINITAQSGTSGQNPSGTVAFDVTTPPPLPMIPISGPVTCLSVTGPDHGAGTLVVPTTAVLNVQTGPGSFGVVTVELVDNGRNDAGLIGGIPFGNPVRAPTDCSPLGALGFTDPLTNGRVRVFDAPLCDQTGDQGQDNQCGDENQPGGNNS